MCRAFRCFLYILHDVFVVPFTGAEPYWNSMYKRHGTWSDYWFITEDLTDKYGD